MAYLKANALRIAGSLIAGGAVAALLAWLLTRGWSASVVATIAGLAVAGLIFRNWDRVKKSVA